MSVHRFQRSMDVVKTRSEGFGESPRPWPVTHELLRQSSAASSSSSAMVQPELDNIRRELDALKRRRVALEAQRQRLLEEQFLKHKERRSSGNFSGAISIGGRAMAVGSTSGLTSTHPQSERDSAAALSTLDSPSRQRYANSVVVASASVIPSKTSRRQHLRPTAQLGMKSAIREAAAHDTTLLMGDFLLEDNPHACTFGRERRFRAVVGQRGKYFLSTDVAVEQLLNRDHLGTPALLRVAQRFDQTPGPGAYTPRYSKVSRAPRHY